MGIEILSIKSSLPKKIDTVNELSVENKNWDIDKIYTSTGINKRHISGENDGTLESCSSHTSG